MAHKTQKVRVVRLIRGVGPSSSPWNNFYGNERKIAPGIAYPPVSIGINFKKYQWCKEWCLDQNRYYIKVGLVSSLIYLLKLATRTQSQGKILIIHVHSPILAIVALLIKLLKPKVKVVTTQHNDWRFFRPHQKLGLLVLTQISSSYITCGKAVVETIPSRIRKSLKSKGLLYSIPNGINPKQLKDYDHSFSVTHGENNTRKDKVIAVVVARMIPQKNCQFLLHLLKNTFAIDRLIWFGDGVERKYIEQQITRLGLEKRIELRGCRPRHEVFTALSEATFYINASKWEGLSVADLEAVALGCWPIMSDIIQRHEIAEKVGIPLYPLSNIDSWVAGINEFLTLPSKTQQEMRKKLAMKTRENFDLTVTVKQYIQLYYNLVKLSKDY